MCIQGLLSEFQYAEKQVQGGSGKAPSLISILQKAISKREEAASQYRSAKPAPREDLAAKEEEQVELIKQYLPKEMDRSEIVEIAKKVVKELKFGPPAFPARAQGGWQPLIPYSRELTDTISSGCRYELRPLLRL